jgi:hypothetical protein
MILWSFLYKGNLAVVGRYGLLGFANVGTLVMIFASRTLAHPSLRMINSIVILFKTRLFFVWVKTAVILAVLSVLHVRIPRRDLASLIVPLMGSARPNVLLCGVSLTKKLKVDDVSAVLNLKMMSSVRAISLKIQCRKISKQKRIILK